MGNARTKHQLTFRIVSPLEFGKPANIDDEIGLDQPQIEHRPERLATGDDLGCAIRLRQQSERCVQILGTLVSERHRFHAAGLAVARAASTASTRRRGEIGECSTSTPSGRKASLTALAIAAGGAIAPPSPIPLTPNVV